MVKWATTGPPRSPVHKNSCPNSMPATRDEAVQGRYRAFGPMCSNAKMALEAHRSRRRQQRAAKKDLLANRRGDGQHQDLWPRQRAKQRTQIAVQGPRPLVAVGGQTRCKDEAEAKKQARHDAGKDLWILLARQAPDARIATQG